MARLRPLHPADRIEAWLSLAEAGDWAALAEGLMRDHYDPRYGKHRARHAAHERAVVPGARLDDAGIDDLAARVQAVMQDVLARA